MTDIEMLIEEAQDARHTLILAHGAGQSMRCEFMDRISGKLVAGGLRIVRFEFPYMTEMQCTGKRRPPDREPVLRATWNQVIDELLASGVPLDTLLIGGKSMGGRIASMIADERGVAGLICLGYPFHPPGKPEKTRIEHLRGLKTTTLICQGTRDPFGKPNEVAGYALSKAIHLCWIEDGDHSFKPRKASERTLEQNLDQTGKAVLGFVESLQPQPSQSVEGTTDENES